MKYEEVWERGGNNFDTSYVSKIWRWSFWYRSCSSNMGIKAWTVKCWFLSIFTTLDKCLNKCQNDTIYHKKVCWIQWYAFYVSVTIIKHWTKKSDVDQFNRSSLGRRVPISSTHHMSLKYDADHSEVGPAAQIWILRVELWTCCFLSIFDHCIFLLINV